MERTRYLTVFGDPEITSSLAVTGLRPIHDGVFTIIGEDDMCGIHYEVKVHTNTAGVRFWFKNKPYTVETPQKFMEFYSVMEAYIIDKALG